jgi:hypothetical protein
MGAKVQAHNEAVPVVDRDTWHLADGFIFGSGTRFGMMTSRECRGDGCGRLDVMMCIAALISSTLSGAVALFGCSRTPVLHRGPARPLLRAFYQSHTNPLACFTPLQR